MRAQRGPKATPPRITMPKHKKKSGQTPKSRFIYVCVYICVYVYGNIYLLFKREKQKIIVPLKRKKEKGEWGCAVDYG